MGIQKDTLTKNELINALKGRTFKEIRVYEPLDDAALKELKSLRKDDKSTVLVLKSK